MNIFPAENQGTQQQRQHSRIYSGFPQSTVARNSRSRRTCLLDEKNKILPIIDSEESEKLLNSLRNIVDEKQQIDNELNVTRETIVKMQNTVMGSNNVLWLLPTIDIAKRDQCIKELSQKTKQRNQENQEIAEIIEQANSLGYNVDSLPSVIESSKESLKAQEKDQNQTIEQHEMDLHSKKLQIDNLQHKLNQAVEKCNTQSEANKQNKEFYEKKL